MTNFDDQVPSGVLPTDALDLPPVLREMLHEQIFTLLKRNLMMGRFAPGQKLPLRSLAASLGTSLMPVRDALQRLESIGCVISTANRTMMVPSFSIKELQDIRTLRMLLEGTAAERAAIERTDAELADLRRYCTDIETAADTHNLDLFLEANYNFHMAIADMSRISFVSNLLEPLWMRIGPVVRQSKPDQAHIRKAVKYHLKACSAIAERDPVAAAAAIREDIMECNEY
ncbi:GntR family transcriptional regulator [Rhodopseudomonas sp. P2A-2r]|uniref:GntR family transcriptional regulator n=1 Tax=unclassified Rhodopseudomonas TaxID=2638247 RepID=UPI0022343D6B|nr:GntR family transcriptional regulator [Rhodopseudomonas sp. P2A-2r]UZE50920.1 GntR family transcriptional regulator [Rhodopseudomonas sp. P2A-2r]